MAIEGVLKRVLVPVTVALMTLGVPSAPFGARADTGVRDVPAIPESLSVEPPILSPAQRASQAVAGEPTRAHFGSADLYVPTFFHPVAGTYDLVVHFHGISSVQERNFEQAGVNAVIVSINKGVASDAYAAAFSAPGSFDALLATTQRVLERTQRISSARLGRIALSAWSAGFASVGAILRQPGNAERIDAILLADGPHVNYLSKGEINDRALEKWARFARAAMQREKLFALTHSSIPTVGYASTTETVGELLRLTSLDKEPAEPIGPRGMRPIYESSRGDCHVEGFEGRTARDHVDQIKAMGETLLPYLRDFWSRGA